MKTVAIVQAREHSERLPRKVLAEILETPLLGLMLERLGRCTTLDDIVVATCSPWEEIWSVANRYGAGNWIGSEEDVLGRVLGAAEAHKADVIVELTGDCPLVDPVIVDEAVALYRGGRPKPDFVSTSRDSFVLPTVFAYPRGMDVRVFSTDLLAEVSRTTQNESDREHVSLYFWRNRRLFNCRDLVAPPELRSDIRLTVDTAEDLEVVRNIFEALYPENPEFGLRDILGYLAAHQEVAAINAGVSQKSVR
jgi:spore coat polysaccharide biosynthesis protein SpsF